LAILFLGCSAQPKIAENASNIEESVYLTFKLSDNVTLERVTHKNRYGIPIAGHMYLSKDLDKTQKHPALLVVTPYGGVKEQGAGASWFISP